MDRGGHLLKSYQINTASTNITTAAFVAFGSTSDIGQPPSAVVVYNGGSQIIGLYSGSAGAGGQICTIFPGIAIRIPCLASNNTQFSLKALSGATQSTGYISIDFFG